MSLCLRVLRVFDVEKHFVSLTKRSRWYLVWTPLWLRYVEVIQVGDGLGHGCTKKYRCFRVPAYCKCMSMVVQTGSILVMIRYVLSKSCYDCSVVLLGLAIRLCMVGRICQLVEAEVSADRSEEFTYDLRSIVRQ